MPRRSSSVFTLAFPRQLPVEDTGERWSIDVDGRRQSLSNLDKVFWPDEGITKGDLVAYYFNIATYILPALRDRPITMKRMPDGIAGDHFYQKDAPDHVPDWITRCAIEPEDGKVDEMILVQGLPDLLFVANLGCIEFHPLHSRCETYDRPDYMVIDLDPFEPAGFAETIAVARHVEVALDYLGLAGVPKTSGATGIQIYVPVSHEHSYEETRDLAERIGRIIEKVDPEGVTTEWEVRRRSGKVFVDFNMNRRAASLAAAYSARPRPGATVSTPLRWEELRQENLNPASFTIATIFDRLDAVGDLFAPVRDYPQSLNHALEKLGVARHPEDISEGRVRRRVSPSGENKHSA